MNHLEITKLQEVNESESFISINNQIIATWNRCRFYLYLNTIDVELTDLAHILSNDASKKGKAYYESRIISLFSELFIEDMWYSNEAKSKIIELFQKALEIYHRLFPETQWQNFFQLKSSLLILSDTWNLQLSVNSKYKFI